MKIRLDFVTNSSSSSYICDICGETHETMDASLEDLGLAVCENGHTICDHHKIEDPQINLQEIWHNRILDFTKDAARDVENIKSGKDTYRAKYLEAYTNREKFAGQMLSKYIEAEDVGSKEMIYKEFVREYGDEDYLVELQCPCCRLLKATSFDRTIGLMLISGYKTFEEVDEVLREQHVSSKRLIDTCRKAGIRC